MKNKVLKAIKNPLEAVSYVLYHIGSKLRVFRYRINPNITIGKNATIEKNVTISTSGGGKIIIGDNCVLYQHSFLLTWGGDIKIGNNFSLNAFSTVYGQGGITIGNFVMVAGNTSIIPANHGFERLDIPMRSQEQVKKGIVIEDDVWIGSGVRVLDGITISKGCVIGAGTVLTKSTEPFSVYVGVPGKKIKDRLNNSVKNG